MHSAFVKINNVPSRITTCGKWIEESFTETEPKELILVITGNPGVTTFYNEFIETLHTRTKLPVWLIGHAGHEQPGGRVKSLQKLPSFKKHPEYYDLQGQIKHKIAFIEQYVPKDVKIHIIGHSVGAYIIMQLLKIPHINDRIKQSYFLFPVLEHIAQSPNGKFFDNLVRHIVFLLIFLASIFALFPRFLQNLFIYIYIFLSGAQSKHLDSIRTMIHPRILKNIFALASDEMQTIKVRDNETIANNLGKIHVYFGDTDNWNIRNNCNILKADFPTLRCESQNLYDHAFVLKNSKNVGNMVSDWIRS